VKIGRFVVLASESGTDPWKVVPPDQVPAWLKDPVTMGRLAGGEMAQDGEGAWYRVDRVAESPIVLPREVNLKHTPAALDAVKH